MLNREGKENLDGGSFWIVENRIHHQVLHRPFQIAGISDKRKGGGVRGKGKVPAFGQGAVGQIQDDFLYEGS